MKDELTCPIVGDLLPLYIEGTASVQTQRAVEEHLLGCAACRRKEAEWRGFVRPGPGAPQKEVDYLKRRRRQGRLRILAAVVATALTLTALTLGLLYFVGIPAGSEGFEWTVRTDESSLWLTVDTLAPDTLYRNWNTRQEGDVLYIGARLVLRPPFVQMSEYVAQFDTQGLSRVYLCGQLVWQEGVGISQATNDLLEARVTYLGDASAVGRLTNALEIDRRCGPFTYSLQTEGETYGLHLDFLDSKDKWESGLLEREMTALAPQLLALVENLDQVSWAWQSEAGQQSTQALILLTLNEADRALEEIAQIDGQPFDGLKSCGQDAAALQRLRRLLGEEMD